MGRLRSSIANEEAAPADPGAHESDRTDEAQTGAPGPRVTARQSDKGVSDDVAGDAMRRYLGAIGSHPLLTAEQECAYATLARDGDFGARQKMIEHNLRLVVSIARNFLNRGVAFPDLIEEGNLGLIHALDKFEPERGFRF